MHLNIYRSCVHCGKLHQEGQGCAARKFADKTGANALRNTSRWQNTREFIKRRDGYLCQACFAEGRYNCEDLEVHHAVKLTKNPRLAFDRFNLITLCGGCHERADRGEISYERILELIRNSELEDKKKLNICFKS